MFKKLSNREKTMLFVLFILIISMGSLQFLINPIMQKNLELKSDLSFAKIQKEQADKNIDSLESLQSSLAKFKESADNFRSFVSKPLTDEEIDSMLIQISRENNLEARDLEISDYFQVVVEGEDNENSEKFCSYKTVSYSFLGEYDMVSKLLNNLFDRSYIEITRFTSNEENLVMVHNVTFNIYMQNAL